MREILFRGKRADNGEWVYGDLRQYVNLVGCEDFYEIDTMSDTIWYGHSYKVIPETVSQFTGLTDKNGNKIFEGDIVCLNRICEHYIVKWNDTQCRFGLYQSGVNEQAGFNKDTMLNYEIIGNIHDNPEFLTDKT